MLVERGEMYGLEIADESDGEIPRGTVYVTLARMVTKGFVKSRAASRGAETRGMPRKLYQATGIGVSVLKARDAYAAALAGDGLVPEGSW